MELVGTFQKFLWYLPSIFLAVTGLLIGIMASGPLVDHVLPRIYGKKLNARQAGVARWCTSIGMALLCFLMAGRLGLGGLGVDGGQGVNSREGLSAKVEGENANQGASGKKVENPVPGEPTGLRMRILSPTLAGEYSAMDHSPNRLFWFAESRLGEGTPNPTKEKPPLLDWEGAKARILAWKEAQPSGKLQPIQFLYTTQDPDDSSPLLGEVNRWCREKGIQLERQTTAEGLP